MATINDLEFAALAARGYNTGSINDRRRAYWANLSGRSVSAFSLMDDMQYILLGNGAVSNKELVWMKGLGAVGTTYDDVRYDFYNRSLLP